MRALRLVPGIGLVAMLLLPLACGSSDSQSGDGGADVGNGADEANRFCNDLVEIICAKLFECFTAEERAELDVPATEGECVAIEQADCASIRVDNACDFGETFQPAQVSPCLAEFGMLTCQQFRDPDVDAVLAQNAPACLSICE